MNEEEDAALKVPKRERMGIFEGMDSRRAREVAGHTNPLELVKKLSSNQTNLSYHKYIYSY